MSLSTTDTPSLSPVAAIKAGFKHFRGAKWWGMGFVAFITGAPACFMLLLPNFGVSLGSYFNGVTDSLMAGAWSGLGGLVVLRAAVGAIPPRGEKYLGSEYRNSYWILALVAFAVHLVVYIGRRLLRDVMPIWEHQFSESYTVSFESSLIPLTLGVLLFCPLFLFAALYYTSGYTFREAFAQSWATGTTHYIPLLKLALLLLVVMIVGAIVVVIGWIVSSAVIYLAVVDAYRQLGGVPVGDDDCLCFQ